MGFVGGIVLGFGAGLGLVTTGVAAGTITVRNPNDNDQYN